MIRFAIALALVFLASGCKHDANPSSWTRITVWSGGKPVKVYEVTNHNGLSGGWIGWYDEFGNPYQATGTITLEPIRKGLSE